MGRKGFWVSGSGEMQFTIMDKKLHFANITVWDQYNVPKGKTHADYEFVLRTKVIQNKDVTQVLVVGDWSHNTADFLYALENCGIDCAICLHHFGAEDAIQPILNILLRNGWKNMSPNEFLQYTQDDYEEDV